MKRLKTQALLAWPWSTTLIGLLQIYVFTCERRAMNWGIIEFFMRDYAFNWASFAAHPLQQLPNLVSHTFLHANTAHITSNLIFFLLFAPAVEKALGHTAFAVGYFLWGGVSALTQGFFTPFSSGLIGASGAISGAAGAFFVLYPLRLPSIWFERAGASLGLRRIIPMTMIPAKVPAFFYIGLWFLSQMEGGFVSLRPDIYGLEVTTIGYWAHIGGFAAGAITVAPYVLLSQPTKDN
ncbi:MAG: rhomboid family intramembrane serine protease [Elusimicrobia bacterium]|nr:rhomboid family intramembrane serine protease [Candidatus Obscuribacterium magneticum]